MKARIQCPHCSKVITVPVKYAGKKGKCPDCSQVFLIPASLAAPPSQPTPPPAQPSPTSGAGAGLPPLTDPTGLGGVMSEPSAPGSGGGDLFGLGGLSNELLAEIERQPTIPISQQTAEPTRIPCPVCGELIVQGAAKCRHCGEIFDRVMKEHEKYRQSKRQSYGGDNHNSNSAKAIGGGTVLLIIIGIVVKIIFIILRRTQ